MGGDDAGALAGLTTVGRGAPGRTRGVAKRVVRGRTRAPVDRSTSACAAQAAAPGEGAAHTFCTRTSEGVSPVACCSAPDTACGLAAAAVTPGWP